MYSSGSVLARSSRSSHLRRTAVVGMLLQLTLAVPASADVSTEDAEPDGAAVIRALRWEGVVALSPRDLQDQIVTAGPDWKPWTPRPRLDEATLAADLDRIAAFYRQHGYYEASAESHLEWNADRSAVRIRVTVQEGLPVRLESWSVEIEEGSLLTPEQRGELLDGLPLEWGSPLGVETYRRAKDELLRRLGNLGHPLAALEGGAEVDLDSRAAQIRWRLLPGPLVHFGEVRIAGLEHVDESLVRREITFREGEVFSVEALEETQRSIHGLGLFQAVTLQPQRPGAAEGEAQPAGPEESPPETTQRWPVEVRVQERPPRSLRLGLGFGTEDNLRAKASWRHRNFFGRARDLEIAAKYSSLVAGGEARFVEPRFLDPQMDLQLSASALRETDPGFQADRFSLGFDLERPLGEAWTVRGGHRIESVQITDLDADLTFDGEEPEESFFLSYLQFELERSTVRPRLDPRQGTWLNFRLEPALGVLGSEVSYLKATAEARWFVPLWRTVLALRLRLGTLEPLGASAAADVPIVKRFFSGGSTSVRGFDYHKLGPLDDDEDPLGGLSLAESSAELRFPIWRQLGGVVFTDAGQVATSPSHFRASDVLFSSGGGLRVTTPIGPLRIDLGYVLNPPPELKDRFQVHLSIGHAF